jgi:hypothetical protein
MRMVTVLAMAAAALGCAAPLQSGGVVVREGAAERLELMCIWRHSGAGQESLCAAPEEDQEEDVVADAPRGADLGSEARRERRVARLE